MNNKTDNSAGRFDPERSVHLEVVILPQTFTRNYGKRPPKIQLNILSGFDTNVCVGEHSRVYFRIFGLIKAVICEHQ